MAPSKKPARSETDSPSAASTSAASSEDVLRPFQEASAKYLQAKCAAQEAAIKQRAQACFDLQDRIREVEQEAYRAIMEATRKHTQKLGQSSAADPPGTQAARAQSQLDYENEVRQVYMDSHVKLAGIAHKVSSEDAGEAIKNYADQQQNAYQSYLADLQQAWSATKSLDPQSMSAIAYNIMFTMHAS
jgi:hypothetical protein